jgi:hypothetical protein
MKRVNACLDFANGKVGLDVANPARQLMRRLRLFGGNQIAKEMV